MNTLKRYEVDVNFIGDVKRNIYLLETDCMTQRVMVVLKEFFEENVPKVDDKGRIVIDDRDLEKRLSTEILITLSGLRHS